MTTLADIAAWHRAQSAALRNSERLARGAERIGNEDAGMLAEAYAGYAAKHEEMASVLELYDARPATKEPANVYDFPASENYSPRQALLSALAMADAEDLPEVLVAGYDSRGGLVIRSSRMSRRDALWLAQLAADHARGLPTP